jgi:hypothetical protein
MQYTLPWREYEQILTAHHAYANPYTDVDVDVWVDFTHDDGTVIRRPAFWDGEQTWKVRFASHWHMVPGNGRVFVVRPMTV